MPGGRGVGPYCPFPPTPRRYVAPVSFAPSPFPCCVIHLTLPPLPPLFFFLTCVPPPFFFFVPWSSSALSPPTGRPSTWKTTWSASVPPARPRRPRSPRAVPAPPRVRRPPRRRPPRRRPRLPMNEGELGGGEGESAAGGGAPQDAAAACPLAVECRAVGGVSTRWGPVAVMSFFFFFRLLSRCAGLSVPLPTRWGARAPQPALPERGRRGRWTHAPTHSPLSAYSMPRAHTLSHAPAQARPSHLPPALMRRR